MLQAEEYNRSRLATTIVAVLTSNTALAAMPGNVFLPSIATGLPKDSVLDVTAIATVDRRELDRDPVGTLPAHLMSDVDKGVLQVLGLSS